MSDHFTYDVAVIGGGPAGLTTAMYTARLGLRTAVFEREGGRHAAVRHVHNLVGVSEDVSGADLAELGTSQLDAYGVDVHPDTVTDVSTDGDAGDHRAPDDGGHACEGGHERASSPRFTVEATHATVGAERVVFATGFTDQSPDVPGLERFTGRGLHYCLHCDAYALGDGSVYVLGHDDHAAEVAMIMLNFTAEVDLLLDGAAPTWSEETAERVERHPVDRVDDEVVGAFAEGRVEPGDADADGPPLGGLSFANGERRTYLGGFAVYGKEYNTDLPVALGCALEPDGAVAVDERGETSVDGAYAVGDVTHGQNQTPVAMGDGALAGVALHKDLRRYPMSADELEAAGGDTPVPAAPAALRARMRRDRDRGAHPGLRDPRPDD